MLIKVAGIDPSLRNWGLAKGHYDLSTGELSMLAIDLVETESEAGKTVRKSSDDLRCATALTKNLHAWLADCVAVFGEVPSGSQSARGMFSNGICLGILGGIGEVGPYKGSLIQVSPQEVKVLATGSKVASKYDMIEWAMERFPNLPWLITKSGKSKGQPTAKNEHMADACAAINAGVHTPEFKNLVRLMQAMNTQNQSQV